MQNNEEEISYKLIDHYPAPEACPNHKAQTMLDLANSHAAGTGWMMEFVGADLIRYTCKECGSFRVYKILSQTTLL